jgi:hypothetical protein
MHGATMPNVATTHSTRIGAALGWLARLPLLTEGQLGVLLGQGDWDIRALLRELGRQELVSAASLDSPEFAEALRLYSLTGSGIDALARQMDLEPAVLAARLPVARAELLARLARVETAVGIADTLAMLVDDLRRRVADGTRVGVTLADAGTTHWAPQRGCPRLAPPAVEAWGTLRVGGLQAPFLLAWDRAGAPRAHRRDRVAAWYRADEERSAPWGPELPPVLVVCPAERTVAQWRALVWASAERRGRGCLRTGVTTVAAVTTRGPLGPIWRWSRDDVEREPFDVLVWHGTPSSTTKPVQGHLRLGAASYPPAHTASAGGQAFRCRVARIVRAADCGEAVTVAEYRAAVALELSATQKTLLGWLAQHPLLPVGHLAALLELREAAVHALLGGLARSGLIAADAAAGFADSEGPRFVLTLRGADILAARDGAPLRRYLREGTIAAEGQGPAVRSDGRSTVATGDVRLADLRRRPEHTAGVHQFALTLAREAARERARGRDHRLLAWLNPVEGQEWFAHAGRTVHIWPDARFRYQADDVVYDLLLEWDRGLVRRRDYARKFAAYAAYLAGRGTHQVQMLRLILVTTQAAVPRVREELRATVRQCAALGDITRLITADVVAQDRITTVL